jgi:ubiquinone/menaquinone biosynthesis C-methylase UbiE
VRDKVESASWQSVSGERSDSVAGGGSLGQAQPGLFDSVAPFYDAWFETPLGALCFEWERDAIRAASKPRSGERVLDVGCGTGVFTAEIARVGACVTGIDVSQGMLASARERMSRERLSADLRFGQAEELPFDDASFDLALTVTMLEFVSSPAAVVAEMARVLKPGGRLVVAVLSSQSVWTIQRRLSRQETIYSSAHFFSPGELVGLLKRYGSVSWRGCVMAPPWYWPPMSGLYKMWEGLGQRLWGRFGAFVVASVVKEDRA